MDEKLLTIVVPAYNVQKYVGQCLESLVRQTSKRFSVIIVDDGSKDERTSEICRNYANTYPTLIQYVRQDNKGLGAARNTGLRMVKTPYVSFLDSDDWLCTRFVERVTDELERYSDDAIDIVFTLPIVYDNLTGQMWDWMDKGTFNWIFPPESRVVDMGIEERIYWLEPNACRRVYKMDFLKRWNFEFPEGTRWEDVYPHYYLLTHARKCMGVPDVGFFYRINVPTSITASGGSSRLEVVSVFDKTLKYLFDGEYSLSIVNSAMRMCVSFSMWSLGVVQDKIRPELVEKLHTLYKSIPDEKMSAFLKTPDLLDGAQKRFVETMLHNRRYKMYYDYQKEAMVNRILDKVQH